jgi:hypothetical protein
LPNAVDEMAPSPAVVALRNRFWQLVNAPDAVPNSGAKTATTP